MARSQTWTRNVSKKEKKERANAATRNARGIVDGRALEDLKRRAEDVGLIVHARRDVTPKAGGKKGRGAK